MSVFFIFRNHAFRKVKGPAHVLAQMVNSSARTRISSSSPRFVTRLKRTRYIISVWTALKQKEGLILSRRRRFTGWLDLCFTKGSWTTSTTKHSSSCSYMHYFTLYLTLQIIEIHFEIMPISYKSYMPPNPNIFLRVYAGSNHIKPSRSGNKDEKGDFLRKYQKLRNH